MNKYLIATSIDRRDCETMYNDYDIIKAKDKNEALKLYNEVHNCNFFYGCIMATKINNNVTIYSKYVTYEHLENLRNDCD